MCSNGPVEHQVVVEGHKRYDGFPTRSLSTFLPSDDALDETVIVRLRGTDLALKVVSTLPENLTKVEPQGGELSPKTRG